MIVLDTHAWVWFIDDPKRIPKATLQLIEKNAQNASVFISCISSWELLTLTSKGRLEFSIPTSSWIRNSERLGLFQFIAVDNEISILSNELPDFFHGDPADRIIAATALSYGAPLITKDSKIRSYQDIRTVW